MEQHKLQVILKKHKAWLNNEDVGERANLRSADLRSADLRSADLRYANLSSADLRYANLRYADLRYADLSSADLSYANLSYADLIYANLSYADLRYADLSSADLSYADLRSADLRKLQILQTQICPQKGSFTAFKKLRGDVIVKLEIPASAARSNAPGSRKCRASKAKVISFYGTKETEHRSKHDEDFMYRVGEIVEPKLKFCDEWWRECESGIHFFLSKEEAEAY